MPASLRPGLRYIPVVVLCAVVAGLVAYLVTKASVSYSVSTSVSVTQTDPLEDLVQVSGSSSSSGQDSDSFISAQVPLLTSDRVRRRATELAGGPLAPTGVSADTDAQTLTIVAQADSRQEAARSANALVAAYRTIRRDDQRELLTRAAAGLSRQVTALKGVADDLRIRQNNARSQTTRATLAASRQAAEDRYQAAFDQRQNLLARRLVVTSGATVISPATPASATPSSTRRIALLAFVLGGVLAALACLIRERGVGVLRTSDATEEALGAPLVAALPAAGRRSRRLRPFTPSGQFAEALRRVRTTLHSSAGPPKVDGSLVVLVTSPGPREGKSLVTAGLGRVCAWSGERVLVISSDLRRPGIEKLLLEGQTEAGMADVLLAPGEQQPKDLVRTTAVDGLHVLPAGAGAGQTVDRLQGRTLRSLIDWARSGYDIVLLDSPPITAVSDALALAEVADATLLVTMMDRTRRSRMLLALQQLREVSARTYVVANRAKTEKVPEGYLATEPLRQQPA